MAGAREFRGVLVSSSLFVAGGDPFTGADVVLWRCGGLQRALISWYVGAVNR